MNKEICTECPLANSIRIAQDTLEENPKFHKSDEYRETIVGSLVDNMSTLKKLVELSGCEGPRFREEAIEVCPKVGAVTDTRNLITNPALNSGLDFTVFSKEKTEEDVPHTTGQYL